MSLLQVIIRCVVKASSLRTYVLLIPSSFGTVVRPDELRTAYYARLILSVGIQTRAIAQSIGLHANNGAICPVPIARHRIDRSILEANDQYQP